MKSSAKKPVLLKQPYCLLRMNYDELYFNIWNYEKVNYLKNINDSLEMGPASGKDCLSKNINFIFLDVVLFWWYVLCFWSAFQGVELSLGRMEFLGEGMLCSGDRPAECWGESLVDAVCFQLTWIFLCVSRTASTAAPVVTWQTCSSFLSQWLHYVGPAPLWSIPLWSWLCLPVLLLARNLQERKWFITCIGAPAFMLLWKLFSSVVHIWLYLLNYYHFLIIGVQYVLMIVEKLLIWWALDYSWVAYHASASCGRWRTLPVITSSSKWVMLGCSKWLRGDLTDDCINCCVCWGQKLLLSHRFCLSGVLLTLVEFLELLFIKATLEQRFGRRLFRG